MRLHPGACCARRGVIECANEFAHSFQPPHTCTSRKRYRILPAFEGSIHSSMIQITPSIALADSEIELTAIRSQGPGGQNVNKVATAIALRFDINASSVPERYKTALMALSDRRISRGGVLTIKAQRFRTQEGNREDAIQRLIDLLVRAGTRQKPRVATKPSKASRAKRVDEKKQRAGVKSLRRKPEED